MVVQQDGNFGASLATDLILGVTCLSHRARVTKSSEILFQDSGITFPCRVGAKLFFEMGFLTYKKARTWWLEADDNFGLLVLQSSREKQEEEYIVQKSLSSWYWASATHRNDLILLPVADVYRFKKEDRRLRQGVFTFWQASDRLSPCNSVSSMFS